VPLVVKFHGAAMEAAGALIAAGSRPEVIRA
jgi:hypothetical protein